jgi:hypothetical protein
MHTPYGGIPGATFVGLMDFPYLLPAYSRKNEPAGTKCRDGYEAAQLVSVGRNQQFQQNEHNVGIAPVHL